MKWDKSLAPLDGTVSSSLRGRGAAQQDGAPTVVSSAIETWRVGSFWWFPVPLVSTSAQELPLLQAPGRFWTPTSSRSTLSGLYVRPSSPTLRALPFLREGAMSKIWPEELREGGGRYPSPSADVLGCGGLAGE